MIVNNGSTDNTKDYLQTIYPHINCIHHYEMISETEALNNILHLIKTPYFFLYDIDIEIRNIEFKNMCKNVIEKNNFLGIFFNTSKSAKNYILLLSNHTKLLS